MPTADELLSPAAARQLVTTLKKVTGQPMSATRAVSLTELGLSDRVRALRDGLLADLPGGAELNAVMRRALADPRFTGWLIWPASEAVAAVATSTGADFEDGLALLAAMTDRLTGEFALRTFLLADLPRTLAVVREWTGHPNEHVRRLATEGTRARLPWAKRVPALFLDPSPTVPVLDRLYRDDSEYVRRSVANHLNDISRIDPDLALTTATGWLAAPAPSTAALVRHSMRSLIKQGHPGALVLMGFPPVDGLTVTGPVLDRSVVPMGGGLEFRFDVSHPGPGPARLAIDYVVHYVKANGSTAPKVFKLTTRDLVAGQRLSLSKKHSFRPISTRVHYPGSHRLELQINGKTYGAVTFELSGPTSTQSRQ